MTLHSDGRYNEAEELLVRVMETRKRGLGEEHPDTLISMANLALTYSNQGQSKEAEKLLVQVIETEKRVLSKAHPDVLISKTNQPRGKIEQFHKILEDRSTSFWSPTTRFICAKSTQCLLSTHIRALSLNKAGSGEVSNSYMPLANFYLDLPPSILQTKISPGQLPDKIDVLDVLQH